MRLSLPSSEVLELVLQHDRLSDSHTIWYAARTEVTLDQSRIMATGALDGQRRSKPPEGLKAGGGRCELARPCAVGLQLTGRLPHVMAGRTLGDFGSSVRLLDDDVSACRASCGRRARSESVILVGELDVSSLGCLRSRLNRCMQATPFIFRWALTLGSKRD